MATDFCGKVVIVTGSSSGLGEDIAFLFASKGARVTLSGRDRDRLSSILDKVIKVGGGDKDKVIAIQGDLNDQRIRKQIVEKTIEKFGRLDILVVNAAVGGDYSSILEITEENYDYILDTNLKSSFFLIKEAIPHLEKTRGNIVIISSIASTTVATGVTAYAITKAALDHLTRCLAIDLGPKGIRVNALNPGYFPTLIFRGLGDLRVLAKKLQEIDKGRQPLHGAVAEGQDVAEAVAFLASDAAKFITGDCIKVDGGRSLSGILEIPPRQ